MSIMCDQCGAFSRTLSEAGLHAKSHQRFWDLAAEVNRSHVLLGTKEECAAFRERRDESLLRDLIGEPALIDFIPWTDDPGKAGRRITIRCDS